MERYLRKPASVNFPEQLRVVRAASVYGGGVSFRASAFSVGRDGSCWRPGQPIPKAHEGEPSAFDALRRNAEAHEQHERRQWRGREAA